MDNWYDEDVVRLEVFLDYREMVNFVMLNAVLLYVSLS